MKKLLVCILFFSTSCHRTTTVEEEVSSDEVKTPVTVTSVGYQPLVEYVDLNATSAYLQTNTIKSSANGYIQSVRIAINGYVKAGTLAFVLKTKEARALGNTINQLNPSFRFSGLIKIYAATSGYVTQLDHRAGDYVQDGEQLAQVNDARSFGFLLNLPYELRPYISPYRPIDLLLPDSTHLGGTVASILPVLDSASQTLSVKISVNTNKVIPPNLIAKARIVKMAKNNVQSLPKAAILTNESQTDFWVMKMIDSVTAVKIPVVKGMESGDRVEIIHPLFNASDNILLTGNYGLADTAKVTIIKNEQ